MHRTGGEREPHAAKAHRLREREAGQSRPGEHQQDPQERQAHHHLRAEQDRHHPQHEGQHPRQQSLARQIALEDPRNEVGEHRGTRQGSRDTAEGILQVDEQAQEVQAEVRRAKGQQETWQELREPRVGQAELASHDDVVAADDDQAGQGEIDHGEEGRAPGAHRGVLIRIGRRRLGNDVERALQDGVDHGLQGTCDLLRHPLGGVLQPAGDIERVETYRRLGGCAYPLAGGGTRSHTDRQRHTGSGSKARLD